MNIFWSYVILFLGIVIGFLITSIYKEREIKSFKEIIRYYREILDKQQSRDPARESEK